MKTFAGGLILCLLLVFCGAAVGAVAAQAPQPQPYEVVEGSDLQRLVQVEGKGKVVIINFFASWCGPCRQEIPHLVSLRNRMDADDVLILGVNFDYTLEDLERFHKQQAINFPVYVAGTNAFSIEGKLKVIRAIPRVLVFNTQGKLVRDSEGVLLESEFNKLVSQLLENAT